MVNIKKATKKFLASQGSGGRVMTTEEHILTRKINIIKKLANRIRRKRARPEEKEEFEQRKKDLKVSSVTYDYYKKDWILEWEIGWRKNVYVAEQIQ